MSLSTSSSSDSDDSEVNYLTNYEIEADPASPEANIAEDISTGPVPTSSDDEENMLCADDPIADQEWTALYEVQIREHSEEEEKLKARLDGSTEIAEWCKCGKCDIQSLQNASECYCCFELDGCVASMESDIVLQDVPQGVKLNCVTEHPGFNPVCLQKWSLRLASWKYKTKQKKRYQKTGSEESFLRSVAYREFSRMVYGVLGATRIPLPACAYTSIRKTFPESGEVFTGFELEED